ncbi:MAG: hypothetical protein H0W62_11755 [Chitinophagales bacterium]|nr:hypothetical protein [Chitinophagales bacterium]
MAIRAILLIYLISSPQTCHQHAFPNVINITSQQWIGGVAGSGYGTYYRIYLLNPDSNYAFDTLWAGKKGIAVSSLKKEVNDTLLLIGNDHVNGSSEQSSDNKTDTLTAPFPFKTDAVAVLGYFYKGERFYYPIMKWTVLKPVYYQ